MFENLGINLEKNMFHRLHRVSVLGLHQPDLLPSVYLGLFSSDGLDRGLSQETRSAPGL